MDGGGVRTVNFLMMVRSTTKGPSQAVPPLPCFLVHGTPAMYQGTLSRAGCCISTFCCCSQGVHAFIRLASYSGSSGVCIKVPFCFVLFCSVFSSDQPCSAFMSYFVVSECVLSPLCDTTCTFCLSFPHREKMREKKMRKKVRKKREYKWKKVCGSLFYPRFVQEKR